MSTVFDSKFGAVGLFNYLSDRTQEFSFNKHLRIVSHLRTVVYKLSCSIVESVSFFENFIIFKLFGGRPILVRCFGVVVKKGLVGLVLDM